MEDNLEESLLVIKLAEQCHTSPDPVTLWFVGWNHHGDDKVGGMTSCGERTSALACFVHWCFVDRSLRNIRFFGRGHEDLDGMIRQCLNGCLL